MSKGTKEVSKPRMIHIRLDEQTHKQLRILVAHRDTTIQQLIGDLVRREVGRSIKLKRPKPE